MAFGALGTPIIALNGVTGIEIHKLSAMVGRQLPLFSCVIPFWLVWAFAGFRGMMQVWPALLVAGLFFAVPQFLMSNFHGPWLVDIVSSITSMAALAGFLRVWHPKSVWGIDGHETGRAARNRHGHTRKQVLEAWIPWIILSVVVFVWGLPQFKSFLDRILAPDCAVPGVDRLIQRMPPVVPKPSAEKAVYHFNILSMTGTGIFFASVLSAIMMGFKPGQILKTYSETLKRVRYSLVTVSAMLSLGFVTRYSGLDATMGLAFARTGFLYPFFGTLLGWLGVALTGSDTSSNVLFGSLQTITAGQVGVSPTLMAAANSTGGVMGKMIDLQSIVVASTATKWYGHEGDILRYVFFHSLALAALVGVLVFLQAHVFPFSALTIP